MGRASPVLTADCLDDVTKIIDKMPETQRTTDAIAECLSNLYDKLVTNPSMYDFLDKNGLLFKLLQSRIGKGKPGQVLTKECINDVKNIVNQLPPESKHNSLVITNKFNEIHHTAVLLLSMSRFLEKSR